MLGVANGHKVAETSVTGRGDNCREPREGKSSYAAIWPYARSINTHKNVQRQGNKTGVIFALQSRVAVFFFAIFTLFYAFLCYFAFFS